MKKFSFLYALFAPIVRPAIRAFYKNVTINHPENLPQQGPVFICSNHVNAFMDPVSLQVHTKRQIFSLARGDVFAKPFMRWLLTQWKLIPIYRPSEGLENMHKNEATFDISRQVLLQNNCLVIYPEGNCIQERRIRPLKKGAARIAFGVEQARQFNAQLKIVPVGMNYSNPIKFRSELVINIGQPIDLKAYQQLFDENKNLAINALTNDIATAMRKLVVQIDNTANDECIQMVLTYFKNDLLQLLELPATTPSNTFKATQYLADTINNLNQTSQETLGSLKSNLIKYKAHFSTLATTKQPIIKAVAECILLVVLIPLALPGSLMNYPPFLMGRNAAKKIAKNIEFFASIHITVMLFSWIGYNALLAILVHAMLHSPLITLVWVLSQLTSVPFMLYYSDLVKSFATTIKTLAIRLMHPAQYQQYIALRNEINLQLKAILSKTQ